MGAVQVNLFEPDFNRSIKVQSTDQRLTSKAGVILLREAEHRLGSIDAIGSGRFRPPRSRPAFRAVAIPNHRCKLQLAIIHRPLFIGSKPEESECNECSRMVDVEHVSIWISYCPMELEGLKAKHLGLFNSHHRLATPVEPWESLKIGGGTPPVMTRHGWMILYHGVHATNATGGTGRHLCYSAGVMILSK